MTAHVAMETGGPSRPARRRPQLQLEDPLQQLQQQQEVHPAYNDSPGDGMVLPSFAGDCGHGMSYVDVRTRRHVGQAPSRSSHHCSKGVHPLVSPTWRTLLATLVLVFMAAVSLPGAHAQDWAAKPEDTDVMEGGRATLRCQIRQLGGSQVAWLKGNQNYFVGGDRWVAPPRFNVSRVEDGDVGGYDLVLSGATREDDSDYTCQLQSQQLIATAHLTVLVKPRILSLTKNQTLLAEGDYVSFTCLTSDGNPAPTITWFRRVGGESGEWEELAGGVTTPPATRFNTSSSVLVRRMRRDDHSAYLRCVASNAATTGSTPPPETILTLDVRYAPVVSISPADASKTRLVVIQGRNATLKCHVDANPPPSSITWERNGRPIEAPDYRAVSKDDAGNYSCIATNVISSTRAWLYLDVQYAPVVTVSAAGMLNSTVYTAEGARVNLSCSVLANPVVDTVVWKDALNKVLYWGQNYVIDDVKRTHAGVLGCHAENILRPTLEPEEMAQGTRNVHLIVQYPPGKANITGPRFVLKGSPAVLTCHLADKGVPAASLEWTRLGDARDAIISRQAELRFNRTRLSHNADYICKATNSVNDGEPDTFRLVVNESPEWTAGGVLPQRQVVNITSPGPLMEQCEARGRPLPQVRWYKDDVPIGDHDGLFTVETKHGPIEVHSFLVSSTLFWRGRNRDQLDRLQQSDSGRYRCEFTNEHGSVESNMQLTVQYMPVLNVVADKVATDMNQSASLSCSAHAAPAPRFEWYNGTQRLVPGPRIHMSTAVVGGPFPHRATLNLTDVSPYDLGDYKCVGVNKLGFAERHIFLTVKTTPDSPTQLKVEERTWESVELSWTPGFDGGYPQSFFIHLVSARHNNTRLKVVPHAIRHNVTGLFPSTMYTFKVFGENSLGGGEYSANVTTVTPAHPVEPPTEVFYHTEKRTLTFRSPSTNYCVRIEVYNNIRWNVYAECAPPTGSVKIRDGIPVSQVRISLCLQRRKEICSDRTKAFVVKPPPDDLSVETIIIVACVCGTVVLVLLVILIFLCIRRHQARRKDYENDLNAQRSAAATAGGTGGGGGSGSEANKKIGGIDNPSLDQTDMVDLDGTGRARGYGGDPPRQNNANYVMFDRRKGQGGPATNGYPAMNGGPGWNRPNGQTPVEPPPNYSEVEKDNRGNAEAEYIAMHKGRKKKADGPDDSGYVPDPTKEGADSPISSPADPSKPKKLDLLSPQGFPFSPGQLDCLLPSQVYTISDPHHWPYWYPQHTHQSLAPPSDATPILRVACDSPYGYQGAAAAAAAPATQSSRKRRQPGSALKRSATVTARDLARNEGTSNMAADVIRGTLHESLRWSPSIGSEVVTGEMEDGGAPFHYGLIKTRRPIPTQSYHMFQKLMTQQDATTTPLTSSHVTPARDLTSHYHTPVVSPSLVPSPERAYEMSMQVSNTGLEVQLEVFHHRTEMNDLNDVNDVRNSPDDSQEPASSGAVTRATLTAARKKLKPGAKRGGNKSGRGEVKQEVGPTTAQESMAAVLKAQKQEREEEERERGESDTDSEHNVKPSAVKKMLHKDRDKKKVPRVRQRPANLEQALRLRAAKGNDTQAGKESSRGETDSAYSSSARVDGRRLCPGCEGAIGTGEVVEAVTDFTTSVPGSTLYKRQAGCTRCGGKGSGGRKTVTLQRPDPPYESDTDSTLPDTLPGSGRMHENQYVVYQHGLGRPASNHQNTQPASVSQPTPHHRQTTIPHNEYQQTAAHHQIDRYQQAMLQSHLSHLQTTALHTAHVPPRSHLQTTEPHAKQPPHQLPISPSHYLPMTSSPVSEPHAVGLVYSSSGGKIGGGGSLFGGTDVLSSSSTTSEGKSLSVGQNIKHHKTAKTVNTDGGHYDLTRHFAPPPPSTPAPPVPITTATSYSQPPALTISEARAGRGVVVVVPSPPGTLPPTPPSVSLIPRRQPPGDRGAVYFTYPDILGTVPTQHVGPLSSRQVGYGPPKTSTSSQSSSSGQPASSYLSSPNSTSLISTDDVSSSATAGSSPLPVTLIL